MARVKAPGGCDGARTSDLDASAGSGEGFPPVLTIAQLSTLLQLPKTTLYERCRRGEIPGVQKVGRLYRAHRDTVLDWVRQGRVSPSSRKKR